MTINIFKIFNVVIGIYGILCNRKNHSELSVNSIFKVRKNIYWVRNICCKDIWKDVYWNYRWKLSDDSMSCDSAWRALLDEKYFKLFQLMKTVKLRQNADSVQKNAQFKWNFWSNDQFQNPIESMILFFT